MKTLISYPFNFFKTQFPKNKTLVFLPIIIIKFKKIRQNPNSLERNTLSNPKKKKLTHFKLNLNVTFKTSTKKKFS